MIDPISITLALFLGFVLERSSMCTVANIERLVVKRRADGVLGLGVAVSWSGVVLLGLATLAPDAGRLPVDYSISALLIAGAVLMGIGSAVNGGCFVGSVVRAGSGDLNFLATLLGLGIGMRLLEGGLSLPHIMAPPSTGPTGRVIIWCGFLVIGIGAVLTVIRRSEHRGVTWRGRWPRAFTLSAAGFLAGLMFARNPAWTYAVAIDQLSNASRRAVDWSTLAAPVALFGGAVLGARLSGRFELRRPAPMPALRCMTGGVLMGAGARMVPGGNDTLLLWSIPGITVYGIVAYVVMTGTIAATVWGMRR
jgi:toxin CptA